MYIYIYIYLFILMYLPHGGAWPLTRPPAVPAGEAGPAPGERRTPMKMIMNISTTTTTTIIRLLLLLLLLLLQYDYYYYY